MDTNHILNYLQTKVKAATDVEASALIGMEVVHTALTAALSLGQGVITDATNGMLTVQFAAKTTRLAFPMSFTRGLSPVDPAIKKRLSELGLCPPPPPDDSYLEFKLKTDKTYSVVGCNEEIEVVDIPAMHKGVPVTQVSSGAFKNVKILNIPDSVINIDCYYPFEAINVDKNNPYYQSKDGVLYSKNGKCLIGYPAFKKEKFFSVNSNVNEISCNAFDFHDFTKGKLKYLHIAKGVQKIDIGALDYCDLEKIYIPETVICLNGEIFSSWYDDGGAFYTDAIVGGKSGSAIEAYCNERNITFIALEDNEVKNFFLLPTEKLKKIVEDKQQKTSTFVASDKRAGYDAIFENGILKISTLRGYGHVDATSRILPYYIREKVKEIIIGDNIVGISNYAFTDRYDALEKVHIGKDVCKIGERAFGDQDYAFCSYKKFSCITVDKENKHFKSVDGVLYTRDMQTLIKYPQNKPGYYFEINCDVAPFAFKYANNLKCIRIGGECKSIGEYAFYQVYDYLHVWIDRTVECFEGEFPFIIRAKRGDVMREYDLIIGGYKDSYAQKQCEKLCNYFLPIEEESEIQKFMTYPFAEGEWADNAYFSETWLKDPYYRECKKKTIISPEGHICQICEHGDELVLPEGAKSINSLDIKGVKKLVIPKTMKNMLTCFKPSPELQEIVVAEGNERYKIVEGHLYSTDGMLLTYLPSAAKQAGVLPEGTLSISAYAFNLLEKPLETLYIPASVINMEVRGSYVQNIQRFYSVEVSPENATYASVDGNLFSRDGKTLICAKVTSGVFTVPDGTEIIGKHSLIGIPIETMIVIPESVKEIQEFSILCSIRTTKGSYAEQYARERKINVEFI